MENTVTRTCTAIIPEKIPPALSRNSSEFVHAGVQETSSAVSHRLRRHKKLQQKRTHNSKKIKVEINNISGSEQEEDEEKLELEEKLMALQRIVPGGESLGTADKLFEETADYILSLQFQVKALKLLTNFLEGSQKERRKLGG